MFFSLKSKEYHEIAIMEVFKNMKVQQYFLKVPSYYITSHDPFSLAKKTWPPLLQVRLWLAPLCQEK